MGIEPTGPAVHGTLPALKAGRHTSTDPLPLGGAIAAARGRERKAGANGRKHILLSAASGVLFGVLVTRADQPVAGAARDGWVSGTSGSTAASRSVLMAREAKPWTTPKPSRSSGST